MPHDAFAGPTLDVLQDLRDIFAYGYMQNASLAGTVVAILAGVVGYFVVLRRLAFATEALSHGGFAGATGAVVIGQDPFLGLLVFVSCAGILMGILGDRLRGRGVAIGATLALSLALGSPFLTISTKLAGEAVKVLFGNILAISPLDVRLVILFASLTLVAVGVVYRPLLFASVDPEIAGARGLPVRGLGVVFMVLLGFTIAIAVQVVGDRVLSAVSTQLVHHRPGFSELCRHAPAGSESPVTRPAVGQVCKHSSSFAADSQFPRRSAVRMWYRFSNWSWEALRHGNERGFRGVCLTKAEALWAAVSCEKRRGPR